jgi:hypothetical protein
MRASSIKDRSLLLGVAWLVLSPWAAMADSNSTDAGLRVYRWVDEQGIVHYGDTVPAQYSERAHDVLNGSGVQIGHVAGVLTASQLTAEQQAASNAAQRAQHDKFLLATYASAQEIERLRDERLDQIEGQIRAASSYIDSLTLRLQSLQTRAQQFAPYSTAADAPRMPDELAQDLVHTLNEARTQRNALAVRRREQLDTTAQFDADLQRYRELTAGPSS